MKIQEEVVQSISATGYVTTNMGINRRCAGRMDLYPGQRVSVVLDDRKPAYIIGYKKQSGKPLPPIRRKGAGDLIFLEGNEFVLRGFDSDKVAARVSANPPISTKAESGYYVAWFFISDEVGNYAVLWVDPSMQTADNPTNLLDKDAGVSPAILEWNGVRTAFTMKTIRKRTLDRVDAWFVEGVPYWSVPRVQIQGTKLFDTSTLLWVQPVEGVFEFYRAEKNVQTKEVTVAKYQTYSMTNYLAGMKPVTAENTESLIQVYMAFPRWHLLYIWRQGNSYIPLYDEWSAVEVARLYTYTIGMWLLDGNVASRKYYWRTSPERTVYEPDMNLTWIIGSATITNRHYYSGYSAMLMEYKIELEDGEVFIGGISGGMFGSDPPGGQGRAWCVHPNSGTYELYCPNKDKDGNPVEITAKSWQTLVTRNGKKIIQGTFGPNSNRVVMAWPGGTISIKEGDGV